MDEEHKSEFYIYPEIIKMYHDLKKDYWWPRIKREMSLYMDKCMVCHKVKVDQFIETFKSSKVEMG